MEIAVKKNQLRFQWYELIEPNKPIEIQTKPFTTEDLEIEPNKTIYNVLKRNVDTMLKECKNNNIVGELTTKEQVLDFYMEQEYEWVVELQNDKDYKNLTSNGLFLKAAQFTFNQTIDKILDKKEPLKMVETEW